jgi:hypothetical protein
MSYILGRTTAGGLKSNPYYYYQFGQRISSIDTNRLVLLSSTHIRSFHSSSRLFDDKSKIEKTVDLLKDKSEEEKAKLILTTAVPLDATVATTTPTNDQVAVKRKTLWQKVVHELKHYYNGFKLLFIETKIAFRLLRQVLSGHTLTRRERKQVLTKKMKCHIKFFYSSLHVQLLIYFGLCHFRYLLLFRLWNLHYQSF